jgi:hypothetical protein
VRGSVASAVDRGPGSAISATTKTPSRFSAWRRHRHQQCRLQQSALIRNAEAKFIAPCEDLHVRRSGKGCLCCATPKAFGIAKFIGPASETHPPQFLYLQRNLECFRSSNLLKLFSAFNLPVPTRLVQSSTRVIIENKSGLRIGTESFSPGAFFFFSEVPPEAGRVTSPGTN